ncbi:hypothetical protein [Pseudogracilibacillus sp. ICA-222130]|uniref:hypothetical protein n=1 Tax=Pseudogracilibacillus sp. ICA-222130 TaxID=3134655 RepID=UPI002C73E5BA|nr:hypothetical protein [Pseudogracilibacillus sp.]
MANKKNFFNKNHIPISQQIIAMNLAFPKFKQAWKKNKVVWTGKLQPTPLSKSYLVEITYSLGMLQPKVLVLDPPLENRGEEKIPHVYPGNKLCLFRPKKKEWTKQMVIAETIVPWTTLWLYYYEMWHATGKWLGGGEHPIIRKRKKL